MRGVTVAESNHNKQEEKAKETAAQVLKAESIRKMEERLAARERQMAEAEAKTRAEAEAQANAETQGQGQGLEEKTTAADAGSTPTTTASGTRTTVAADAEEKSGDEEVGAFPGVDTVTTITTERAGPTAAAGFASGGLPAIAEEDLTQPKLLPGSSVPGSEADFDEKGDGGESGLQEAERAIDNNRRGGAGADRAEPNADTTELTQRQDQNLPLIQENKLPLESEDALNKAVSKQEETKQEQSHSRSPVERAAAGIDNSGVQINHEAPEASPARLELAKQRAEIAVLVAQAKEGTAFVSRSVDMADVLRGFEFTQHGVPVRDPAVKRELLRDGRSTLRDRLELMRTKGAMGAVTACLALFLV